MMIRIMTLACIMQIPADMFVNSIIVAMKTHINQSNLIVYQVGSSYRNPISFNEVHDILFGYFTKNPWTNREGNLVKIRRGFVLSNILIFEIIFSLLHSFVQMALILASRMGGSSLQRNLLNFDKELKIAMRLVELYKPYVFFKGIFADTNTEKVADYCPEKWFG
ncbi:probable fatty acyl-CoA reductase 4 [Chenopodium quinoa]|uniref:probable fatty acyl-CoA reductase 4 n=1 Tax=Chenopodium quinoa TaxID=63459 RepID=UPI000B790BFC|nr:probable fatty acyl-CoA reductase 4 [Chenopodium quinoa]